MAVGRVGGTRSKIRGKVGNEIYQIMHAADGKLVQIVRAIEESRYNPNTFDQRCARLAMSVIMRAMSQFKPILQSSWEGSDSMSASFESFVRANYPVVRDYVDLIRDALKEGYWPFDPYFNMPDKHIPSVLGGIWQISAGTLSYQFREIQNVNQGGHPNYEMRMWLPAARCSWAQFIRYHQISVGDYWTQVFTVESAVPADGLCKYVRMTLADGWDSETILTTENVPLLFLFEGNFTPIVFLDSIARQIVFRWDGQSSYSDHYVTSWGIVKSVYKDGLWRRANEHMQTYYRYMEDDMVWRTPLDVWPQWEILDGHDS